MKYIIFPVVLIGSVAMVIWLIIPSYQRAVHTRDVELVAARQQLATEQETNKTIASLKEDYELRKDDLKTVRYALPEQNEIEPFLVQLEAILAESGAYYEAIDFSGQGDDVGPGVATQVIPGTFPRPETITASIDLVGSYEVIAKVITSIENLNRLCNVTILKIKAAEDSGDSVASSAPVETEGEAEGEVAPAPAEPLSASIQVNFYKQLPINSASIKGVFEASPAEAENSTGVSGMPE